MAHRLQAPTPPPSVHSVPSCQKFFRVFRVFRGPTLRPPPSDFSVPSCQKFFRVFRVFRGPTLRPPPSAVRPPRRVNHGHEGWPPFSVAKPNLHLPALDVYFYNSATPTITGKERGPWSLTVDFGDTCLFHDENSLSSRYSTVVWTTAKIRPRRRVHRDNESPKGRGNALSAAGLKTRQTPLGRS